MVLYCLLLMFVAVQCGYAFYFFRRIYSLSADRPLSVGKLCPVSVIICAKNEAANLRKNLPLILAQHYADTFEVIVVNDASTDDTKQVLAELMSQYDNLHCIEIAPDAVRNLKGKKHALAAGAAHAKHSWLVLTDADCAPASDQWLELMVAPLADGKEIVAGYSGYEKRGGMLNAFIRWETLHTFIQYSSYAIAGMPYMAVGRNLACTMNAIMAAQQSDIWNALPSGDDDLLVRIAGNAHNMAVVCAPEAFTSSTAKGSWAEWVAQKERHLSTGKYYLARVKLLLGGYAASHAAMWLTFFVLLFQLPFISKIFALFAIGSFSVRCAIYWALWAKTATRLHERSLIYLFPLFDMAWMLYNCAFFPYITWKNKQHWK